MNTPAAHPARPAADDALGMMAWARRRDPIGDKAQGALIAAVVFMLPLGTAPLAIMFAIALGYSLLRLWATGPAIGYLIRLPIVWVLLAMLGWTAASLLWTSNRTEGWDEATILRFQLPFLIAFWPVVERWRMWVWALAAGVAVASLVQIGQWTLGDHWPMFLWWHAERIPGRYPGLLHPNSTALVALASVLLLPQIFVSGRREWAPGLVLWVFACVGLVLTGSRGCWIAAIAGGAVSVPSLRRRWQEGQQWTQTVERGPWARRTRWMVWAAFAVIATVFGVSIGPQVTKRVSVAVTDLQAAIDRGDYSGDVAARWRQFEISFRLVAQHPLTGVGVGSYLEEARRVVQTPAVPSESESPAGDLSRPIPGGLLAHPHSALLYHLSVLGWPGLALYLAMWGLLILEITRGLKRDCPDWVPIAIGLFAAFALDSHNMSAPGTLLLLFVIGVAVYQTRSPSSWAPPGDAARDRRDDIVAGVDDE